VGTSLSWEGKIAANIAPDRAWRRAPSFVLLKLCIRRKGSSKLCTIFPNLQKLSGYFLLDLIELTSTVATNIRERHEVSDLWSCGLLAQQKSSACKGHLKMDGGYTNIFLYRIQLLNSIPNFVKIQDIQTQAAGKTPGHSILKLFGQFWPEHRLQVWYLHIKLPIHYWEISMLTVMVTRTKRNFHKFAWFFHRQLHVLIFWKWKILCEWRGGSWGKNCNPSFLPFYICMKQYPHLQLNLVAFSNAFTTWSTMDCTPTPCFTCGPTARICKHPKPLIILLKKPS